jgi:hypothetical protein
MDGMDASALLWFRQDLRLADNPALAALEGRRLLPVFVLDDAAAGAWAPGGATRWWLHHSLAALGGDLASRGAPLLLARGRAEIIIPPWPLPSVPARSWPAACWNPGPESATGAWPRRWRPLGAAFAW